MGLADTLFWPALITIAITSRRWMQAISLTFTVMMFAAAGERQAFVALLAFVLLDRFFLGRRCVVHYFIAIFSVWLLSALIFLRYEWTGGLYNVLVALFSFDSGLLDFVIFSVNYMSVFSVTSITASIESFSVDPIPFMYAINPLPSFFVSGWHEFSGVMSVRANVPYAALAMIYNNLGLPGVFLVGFIVGIFAFAIFLFKRRVNIVSLLLLVAFFLVPYLFGLQYNLRAYSRLLYFIGISLLAYQFFFRRVRIRLKG